MTHILGFSEAYTIECTLLPMLPFNRLSSERAIASPSESSAIVTAFMECLRFAILLKIDEEDDQRQIHRMLIYDQVFIRNTQY